VIALAHAAHAAVFISEGYFTFTSAPLQDVRGSLMHLPPSTLAHLDKAYLRGSQAKGVPHAHTISNRRKRAAAGFAGLP
jgi:hypothetical protein